MLFRSIALKAAQTVVRRLTVRDSEGWHSSDQGSDAGEIVGPETALSLSAVWACVNLIAGTCATLPFVVYRTKPDGSREVASDHSLYLALHDRPNRDQTAVDFWEFVVASLELQGNAFARVARLGGRVTGLFPVPPQIIGVRRLGNGDIEYRWSEDGRSFVETGATMLHIRGFGGNPLGGMSTLQFGRHAFGLARAIDRAAGATFKNGLRPSGLITFPSFLNDQQREILERKLVEKFAGAMNAGRPMVLEGGSSWSGLSINPEDAQMLESRGFGVEEICRFFGVPPFMIGHTEKSTSWGTGLEQQTLGFQKFTLRRRLKRIEQAVTQQLLSPAERASGIVVEFNLEGLLRGDSAARARFYQLMTQIGAMTINEVRALENLPKVPGGDVPRMQIQNVPITDAQIGHNGGPPLEDQP